MHLSHATEQYPTSSAVNVDEIKTEDGLAKVSTSDAFFLNSPGAPYGDGWCQLRENCREVHQYKLVEKGINSESFESERKKAAAENDFFIIYSPLQDYNEGVKPPINSAFVDKSTFKAYYGLFSGRAFSMAQELPVSINTATRAQLESIAGVGEIKAAAILEERKKRKFNDLHDGTARLQGVVGVSVLKKFKFS